MSWLLRLLGVRSPERADGDDAAAGAASDFDIDSEPIFVCSSCGRTDLPETGGWDPPICQECAEAINFDELTEELGDG